MILRQKENTEITFKLGIGRDFLPAPHFELPDEYTWSSISSLVAPYYADVNISAINLECPVDVGNSKARMKMAMGAWFVGIQLQRCREERLLQGAPVGNRIVHRHRLSPFGSSDNVIRYNVVHDNGTHGIFTNYVPSQNNKIIYNLIYDHPQGSCILANYMGHEIYNNTGYNNREGIHLYIGSTTRQTGKISVKNNLIVRSSQYHVLV
jgi:hypothetical protein